MDHIENFSAIGIDTIQWEECTNTWFFKNRKSLVNKPYFNNSKLYGKVNDWVYAHRDEIDSMSLEEQEERMIADGVLLREDIGI